MEIKLKQSLIYLYTRQGGTDWHQLGRAISWRIRAARHLAQAVNRGKLAFADFTAAVAGLTIQRQIEDELDKYQEDLQDLAGQLQAGEIDQDEFTERLEVLTAAILLIALLRGSASEGEAVEVVLTAAVKVLESVGTDEEAAGVVTSDEAISAAIPDEAGRAELDSELAIASVAAAGLAADLLAGTYEDKEEALFSRLAMWATTALGVYAVGQLMRRDDPFLEWAVSPLKHHCSTCGALSGVVRPSSVWYNETPYRPQARNGSLECGGWLCGCVFLEVEGPSRGNLP